MARVLLTRAAEADLDALWDWIATDNPSAAERFTADLERKFRSLADHPLMGRECEILGRGLRRLTVNDYAVIYRIEHSCIEIIRLLHGARDIEALFDEE